MQNPCDNPAPGDASAFIGNDSYPKITFQVCKPFLIVREIVSKVCHF